MTTEVKSDKFYFLPNSTLAAPLPVPKTLHNEGNYIISLGNLCRWLAEQAEEMGVEIYPGFSASEFVEGPDGEILGVATSDMGIGMCFSSCLFIWVSTLVCRRLPFYHNGIRACPLAPPCGSTPLSGGARELNQEHQPKHR